MGTKSVVFTAQRLAETSVLLPDCCGEAVRFAAEELVRFIKDSMGAEPKITEERNFSGCSYISLGNTECSQKKRPKADLNYDGFCILCDGYNINITADNDRGVLYGVYEFLERYFSVRFVAEDCTVVPRKKRAVIPVGCIIEAPVFRMRNYYNSEVMNNYLFAVRKRMFSDFTNRVTEQNCTVETIEKLAKQTGHESEWAQTLGNGIHNSVCFVPREKYYAKHPEFYSFTTNPNSTKEEICFSSGIDENGVFDPRGESVASIVIERLLTAARSEPNAKFFMFGKVDDGEAYCTCDSCRRNYKKYGGPGGVYLLFVNTVAREFKFRLQAEQPGREANVVMFAYQYSEQPPVKKECGKLVPINERLRLADNVYVRLAPISADYGVALNDRRQLKFYREMFAGWQALGQRFMVWDYCCNYHEYAWYFPNLKYMRRNLLYYRKIGAVYVMNQSSYNCSTDWQANLKCYVAAKLYWAPNRSVRALTNEYLNLYYEIAAPYVRRLIDLSEKLFADCIEKGMRVHVNYLSVDSEYLSGEAYPMEYLTEAIGCIDRAMDEVKRSDLSDERKNILNKRLACVLLTPLRMAQKKTGDTTTKYALRFTDCAAVTGLDRIGENVLVKEQKS